jgi:hypothetical protein
MVLAVRAGVFALALTRWDRHRGPAVLSGGAEWLRGPATGSKLGSWGIVIE